MLDEIQHPLLLLPFDTVDEPVYVDSKSYNGMWDCWAVDNAVQKQNQQKEIGEIIYGMLIFMDL